MRLSFSFIFGFLKKWGKMSSWIEEKLLKFKCVRIKKVLFLVNTIPFNFDFISPLFRWSVSIFFFVYSFQLPPLFLDRFVCQHTHKQMLMKVISFDWIKEWSENRLEYTSLPIVTFSMKTKIRNKKLKKEQKVMNDTEMYRAHSSPCSSYFEFLCHSK